MPPAVKSVLEDLIQRRDISSDAMAAAIGAVMDGACEPVEISALLAAHAVKGATSEEVAGAARAMRDRATRIPTSRSPLLDTCGTGGDQLHTFNISTATAIVASACGVAVAKHGNRSVSSKSGSADVLESLGVAIDLDAEACGRCLDEIGIAFCFAPMVHGAMKHAAPVRRALGIPTIFNLLGPLTNPAGAEYQLLGASSDARAELLANALARLGTTQTLVVCGNNELDEVCLWGPTTVFRVVRDRVSREQWEPAQFGLPVCQVADLRVDGAQESAEMIRRAFAGESGPATDMIIVNTAAALLAANHSNSLSDAVIAAQTAISSGAAAEQLRLLAEWTTSASTSTTAPS